MPMFYRGHRVRVTRRRRRGVRRHYSRKGSNYGFRASGHMWTRRSAARVGGANGSHYKTGARDSETIMLVTTATGLVSTGSLGVIADEMKIQVNNCDTLFSGVTTNPVTPRPLCRDEWAAIYGNYTVLAHNLTVRIMNTDSVNNLLHIVPLPANQYSTTIVGQLFEPVMNQAGAITMYPNKDGLLNQQWSSGWVSSSAFDGNGPRLMETDINRYSGTFGVSGPSAALTYQIGCSNAAATDSVYIRVMVTLQQRVRLWGRKKIGSSSAFSAMAAAGDGASAGPTGA